MKIPLGFKVVAVSLAFAGAALPGAMAATVVDLQVSPDYVTLTNGQKMNGYTSAVTSVAYVENVYRNPSSGYNTALSSAPFLGGAESTMTNGLTTYRVNQVAAADIFQAGSTVTGTTSKLAALYMWKQADFLSLTSGTVYLNSTTLIEIDELRAGASGRTAEARIVLKQGSNYYISSVFASVAGTSVASVAVDPTTLDWYSYDPLTSLLTVGAEVDLSNLSFSMIGVRVLGACTNGTAAPAAQFTGFKADGLAAGSWAGDTLNGLIRRQVTIGGYTRYVLIKLPDDFFYSHKKYPTLFFFHGSGECNNPGGGAPSGLAGTPRLLNHGPLHFAHTGTTGTEANPLVPPHPMAFTNPRDGKTYKFIVVSPQSASGGYGFHPDDIRDFYLTDSLIADRIDPKALFITGLSLGARTTGLFMEQRYEDFLPEIAGLVPMSFWVDNRTPGDRGPDNYADYSVARELQTPVWMFCGTNDTAKFTVATDRVALNLNRVNPGQATVTWYNGGHSGWNAFYHPTDSSAKRSFSGTMMNLYEWCLYNMKTDEEFASPLLSVQSLKTHGANTLELSMHPGRSDVEPRLPAAGGGYTLRVNFLEPVVSMTATVGATNYSGSLHPGDPNTSVRFALLNISGTGPRTTVALSGSLATSGAYSGTVSFRALAGDVNGDGQVNASDRTPVQAQNGQTATLTSGTGTPTTVVREDVNFSGTVTSGTSVGTDEREVINRNGNSIP